MSEQWSVSGPKVIEVGGPDEPVRRLVVTVVAGRVDVVAHDDDSATVEVSSVGGRELQIRWEAGVLTVSHPELRWEGLLEGLRRMTQGHDRVEVTVAVPRGTQVRLGTVTAEGLLAGVHAPSDVRTVSGSLVIDGVVGRVGARTVSGRIDVRTASGALEGETVSGSLTVQGVLPELALKTVSGNLTVDLHGGPSQVSTTSVSGDLTVRIPHDAGYRLAARTVSGHLVADGVRVGDRKPGSSSGQARDGDEAVRIDARSVSGDVTLLRAARPATDVQDDDVQDDDATVTP
jgi:hypothetical protein